LRAFRLAFAAVIDARGEIVAEAGDPGRLTYAGMASALLGPYGSARKTYEWILSEELLPQGYAQGGDFAILDKPADGYVVVICGTRASVPSGLDAVGAYHWRKSVSDRFRAALQPVLTSDN
jgi:hypothetical protein